MIWSLRLFACGSAVLSCFSLPLFAFGEKGERKKEFFPRCPLRLRSGQVLSVVEGVNSDEKACPVRLRSGQALSVVEGTLGSSDGVSPAKVSL